MARRWVDSGPLSDSLLPMSMSRTSSILIAALLLPFMAGVSHASDGEELVEARLLSAASALPAGGTVLVGVALDIEPGWYVYWKSPGDAGLPTRVELELPEGFEVEALGWPAPERRVHAGSVSYVHERQLTLVAAVEVPAGLSPGTVVTLRARLQWLVCKDVCFLVEREVSLSLPIAPAGAAPRSPDAARLEAARAGLPAKAAPEGLRATWSEVEGADERFTLALELPGADALAFCALLPDELVPEAMATRGRAVGSRLELVYPGRVRGRTVTGLLAVTRGETTKHYEVELPGP